MVDALEPSWGVVYPRFDAVVSQLGGELSHAAILLREANLPGVINATGAFHELAEGDTVRVDPARGEVRSCLSHAASRRDHQRLAPHPSSKQVPADR